MIAEIIINRIKTEILKYYNKLYRNLWFLMKKNNTKYWLINIVIYINKIIIKNANLSSLVDDFLKKFIKMIVDSYINFLLDYN